MYDETNKEEQINRHNDTRTEKGKCNKNNSIFISISEASKISGIESQTLRKLGDQQKVKCYRTPTGQRKFDKDSLEKMCQGISEKSSPINTKRNFIYARVSSKKQLEDLSRQIEFLQTKRPDYLTYTLIQDVASGINFKRKGLQTILDSCLQGTIGEVVVAHRDRLCRFGYEIVEYLVTKSGGRIVVVSDESSTDDENGNEQKGKKSTEQELAEDLLSIVHIYSCRQMGKRKYRTNQKEGTCEAIQEQVEKESL